MNALTIVIIVVLIIIAIGLGLFAWSCWKKVRTTGGAIRDLRASNRALQDKLQESYELYQALVAGQDNEVEKLKEEKARLAEEFEMEQGRLEMLEKQIAEAEAKVAAQRELERREEEAALLDEAWKLEGIGASQQRLVETLKELSEEFGELSEDLMGIA